MFEIGEGEGDRMLPHDESYDTLISQEDRRTFLESIWCFVPSVIVIVSSFVADATFVPFQRDISEYSDGPAISHPRLPQTVSANQLYFYAWILPAMCIALSCSFRRDWELLRVALLGFFEAAAIKLLITTFAKKCAGSLRPNFYSLCGWNGTACIGPDDAIISARQSFPSGHASSAGAGLTYLALFLCHLARSMKFKASYLEAIAASVRITALLPVIFAVWISITRTIDYYHRFEDITAGLGLGVGAAFACASGRLQP